MTMKNITSEDGINYKVLETPGEIQLNVVSKKTHDDLPDDFKIHHLYVKCEDIRQNKLPLDANPREPTRADVVREMILTLNSNPKFFHHWNNGISIIIDKYEIDENDNKCGISFNTGDGICNGGHTYFAIETMENEIDENALVHLELIQLPESLSKEERICRISDIASARNRNRQLSESTQADYLHYYDVFQKSLGDFSKYVSWHEGDSHAIANESIKSEHFIRLLAALDPHWYSHPIISPTGGLHNAAQGTKSIHSKWFDAADTGDIEYNLYHMHPLCLDLFRIRDLISYSLKNDNLIDISPRWRGTSFYHWLKSGRAKIDESNAEKTRKLVFYKQNEEGLAIPQTMEVILTGLFRHNIWIGKNDEGVTEYIGWLIEPTKLWNETKIDILKRLTQAFEDADRDPVQFKKKNDPYNLQLINILVGKRLPEFPVIFYRVEDLKKFKIEELKPKYFIEYIPKQPLTVLKELHDKPVPEGLPGYSEF